MIYTSLTNQAMRLAYTAHHGQVDKAGQPYIFHPYHVAEQMTDEVTTCVALLHDVVEDTSVTMEMLEALFPRQVTEPLKLLTHKAGTDYFDYVRSIKHDTVARIVKLADIAHNSDESRLSDCREMSPEQVAYLREKYAKAKAILEE